MGFSDAIAEFHCGIIRKPLDQKVKILNNV
jgi:hypothetical protein